MTALHGEVDLGLDFQISLVIQRVTGIHPGICTEFMKTGQVVAGDLRSRKASPHVDRWACAVPKSRAIKNTNIVIFLISS